MSGSTTAPDLKWIEDDPKDGLSRPGFDEFEAIGQRNFSDSILKKCADNLLVPAGLLATVACLTMGLFNMGKGNSVKQQYFMRGRVGFQGATLIAMATTMYVASKQKERKRRRAREAAAAS